MREFAQTQKPAPRASFAHPARSKRIRIQPKLKIGAAGDAYEQEADRIADTVMRMPEPGLQRACACGGGCPGCQSAGSAQGMKRNAISHLDVPVADAREAEIIDQPPSSGATPTSSAKQSNSCVQPISMDKRTSGTFLGNVTMNNYYPDLAGGEFYSHPGSGGTFDTGSRAGANIQLYGLIPSPCSPNQFSIAQIVTRTRLRIDGVAHPEEGKTFDDIGKSRRDASRPPFRQEFLGGGTAPLGYIISMADPPSTAFTPTSTIEHDRDFVTSLIGPSGQQSVSWSLSTRITKGVVTKNVLT